MSRTRVHRLVFVACAITLGLILVGYAIQRFREITGNLDRLLVQQLETQLGRPVRSGRVIVTRSGNFTIRNLQIAEGPSFENGIFFQADRIEGKLNLFSPGLLRNEPIRALESITFHDPRMVVIRQKTGRWNLQDFVRPRKPGAKPVRFSGVAAIKSGTLIVRDYAARLSPRTLPAENRLTSIEGMVDGRNGSALDFKIGGRGGKRLGSFLFSGRYDPLGRDGTVAAQVRSVDAPYWLDYFSHPSRMADLRAGQVNLDAKASLRNGKLVPSSLEGMAVATGGVLALQPLEAPLRSIRARIQSQGRGLRFTASATLENIPLTLTGRIPNLDQPDLRAQAAIGAFNVGRLPHLLAGLHPRQWPGLTGPV
ncbi:MAG: DUF748 domain-containing protein, partial [Armatimonadetes bacterium]|nr:DUF748 domain-containing protein [Armatimonadota bacterium]